LKTWRPTKTHRFVDEILLLEDVEDVEDVEVGERRRGRRRVTAVGQPMTEKVSSPVVGPLINNGRPVSK